MKIYTIQLAKWRNAVALDIPYLDTTVKSGEKTFAPTWEMVRDYKNGLITDNEYTEQYKQLMRESYRQNKDRWLEVANMEKVAFACYCSEGAFCHRLILKDLFKAVCQKEGIQFMYLGEIH